MSLGRKYGSKSNFIYGVLLVYCCAYFVIYPQVLLSCGAVGLGFT